MARLLHLTDGSERAGTAVVFVHGLAGDPWLTWGRSPSGDDSLFWPAWLAQDLGCVRVYSVEYEAAPTDHQGKALWLDEQALVLLNMLLAEPSLRSGPVAFVTHSMGGLLVKKALQIAQLDADLGDSDRSSAFRSFLDSVRGVVFIATPHLGADLAAVNAWLKPIAKPSKATQGLAYGSSVLKDLNEWYRRWGPEVGIEHLVFTETEETRIGGLLSRMVVTPESANPSVNARPIPVLGADHIEICKPTSREALVYRGVADFLRHLEEDRTAPKGQGSRRSARAAVRLRRLSDQTARESGQVVDDSSAIALSGLYVERDLEPVLRKRLRGKATCIVLVGDSGSGKTSLLWHLHQRLQDETTLVLLLRAEAVADVDDGEFALALREMADGSRRLLLLLDTADAVVPDPAARGRLLTVIDTAVAAGASLVVTSRPSEARRFLAGYETLEVAAEYSDREFGQVLETHARYYYRRESLAPIDRKIAELRALVAQGQPVADLVVRPLLLRMLFSLYAPDKIPGDISAARLYSAFWDRRVRCDWRAGRAEAEPSSRDCAPAALAIAYEMLVRGTLHLSQQELAGVTDLNLDEIAQLVSRGVLKRISLLSANDAVEFFHQTFFEHAAGRALHAYRGAEGLPALAEHLKSSPDDHLRAPILEHALVVADSFGADGDAIAQKVTLRLLSEGPAHLQRAAVSAYAQLGRPDESLRAAFGRAIQEARLATQFIACTPSSPAHRLGEVWECFRLLWAREAAASLAHSTWSVRRAILRELPRLVHRAGDTAAEVASLLSDSEAVETVEVGTASELAELLRALAPAEPARSLRLLESYLARLRREFPNHPSAFAAVALVLVDHPSASLDSLRQLDEWLAESKGVESRRVRAEILAQLWRREHEPIERAMDRAVHGVSVDFEAFACLLRGSPTDWTHAWRQFCAGDDPSLVASWVRNFWDRLGRAPLDTSPIPPVLVERFLMANLRDEASRGAVLHLAEHSTSFDLRQSLLRHLLEDRHDAPDAKDFEAKDRLGLFLGPAIAQGVSAATKALHGGAAFDTRVTTRLYSDIEEVLGRAPEATDTLAQFLILKGEYPRLQDVIQNLDLRLKRLPVRVAERLSVDIAVALTSSSARNRQVGARWAYYTARYDLGASVDFDRLASLVVTEADGRVAGWIAMAMCALARSESQLARAVTIAEPIARAGDEYVRSGVLDAWLDSIVDGHRLEHLSAAFEIMRARLDLRSARSMAMAIPRIARFNLAEASRLANSLLRLPELQSTTKARLHSFRREALRPFIEWTQQAPIEHFQGLIDELPTFGEEIGHMILSAIFRPPHASRLQATVVALANDERLDPSLRSYAADLLRARASDSGTRRWDPSAPA